MGCGVCRSGRPGSGFTVARASTRHPTMKTSTLLGSFSWLIHNPLRGRSSSALLKSLLKPEDMEEELGDPGDNMDDPAESSDEEAASVYQVNLNILIFTKD